MSRSYLKSQRGLSLIELLVAMLIASVIMAGVINTLLAGKSAYLYDEEVSFIQENARFALDYMTRDIREAGYSGGCNISSARVANTIRTASPLAGIIKTTGIEGFEGRTGTPSTFHSSISGDVYGDTDAFIVRRADSSNALTVTSHVGASSVIEVSPNHSYADDTVMMMVNADCSKIGIFATSSTQANKLQHNKGNGASENCTKNLTADPVSFDCNGCPTNGACPNSSNTDYDPGSSVYRVSAKAFYIDESNYDTNTRSLYIKSAGNGGSFDALELVSGVEDMQIQYGVDVTLGGQPDGDANRYYFANEITVDEATAGSSWIGWDRVVSVRITLTLRSRNPVLSSDTTKTMAVLGTSYTDRYLYQEVSTVVKLRNSALPGNPVN